jgi:hypothetical protein
LSIKKDSPCEAILMSVLAPTGELLSFAWPKKVTKEKATRPPLISCAPKLLLGVGKSFGARRGRRENKGNLN